jgi:hypothetical protein
MTSQMKTSYSQSAHTNNISSTVQPRRKPPTLESARKTGDVKDLEEALEAYFEGEGYDLTLIQDPKQRLSVLTSSQPPKHLKVRQPTQPPTATSFASGSGATLLPPAVVATQKLLQDHLNRCEPVLRPLRAAKARSFQVEELALWTSRALESPYERWMRRDVVEARELMKQHANLAQQLRRFLEGGEEGDDEDEDESDDDYGAGGQRSGFRASGLSHTASPSQRMRFLSMMVESHQTLLTPATLALVGRVEGSAFGDSATNAEAAMPLYEENGKEQQIDDDDAQPRSSEGATRHLESRAPVSYAADGNRTRWSQGGTVADDRKEVSEHRGIAHGSGTNGISHPEKEWSSSTRRSNNYPQLSRSPPAQGELAAAGSRSRRLPTQHQQQEQELGGQGDSRNGIQREDSPGAGRRSRSLLCNVLSQANAMIINDGESRERLRVAREEETERKGLVSCYIQERALVSLLSWRSRLGLTKDPFSAWMQGISRSLMVGDERGVGGNFRPHASAAPTYKHSLLRETEFWPYAQPTTIDRGRETEHQTVHPRDLKTPQQTGRTLNRELDERGGRTGGLLGHGPEPSPIVASTSTLEHSPATPIPRDSAPHPYPTHRQQNPGGVTPRGYQTHPQDKELSPLGVSLSRILQGRLHQQAHHQLHHEVDDGSPIGADMQQSQYEEGVEANSTQHTTFSTYIVHKQGGRSEEGGEGERRLGQEEESAQLQELLRLSMEAVMQEEAERRVFLEKEQDWCREALERSLVQLVRSMRTQLRVLASLSEEEQHMRLLVASRESEQRSSLTQRFVELYGVLARQRASRVAVEEAEAHLRARLAESALRQLTNFYKTAPIHSPARHRGLLSPSHGIDDGTGSPLPASRAAAPNGTMLASPAVPAITTILPSSVAIGAGSYASRLEALRLARSNAATSNSFNNSSTSLNASVSAAAASAENSPLAPSNAALGSRLTIPIPSTPPADSPTPLEKLAIPTPVKDGKGSALEWDA